LQNSETFRRRRGGGRERGRIFVAPRPDATLLHLVKSNAISKTNIIKFPTMATFFSQPLSPSQMAPAMFVIVLGLMLSFAAFAVEMCRGKSARSESGGE
jgi:hypothetical protein